MRIPDLLDVDSDFTQAQVDSPFFASDPDELKCNDILARGASQVKHCATAFVEATGHITALKHPQNGCHVALTSRNPPFSVLDVIHHAI